MFDLDRFFDFEEFDVFICCFGQKKEFKVSKNEIIDLEIKNFFNFTVEQSNYLKLEGFSCGTQFIPFEKDKEYQDCGIMILRSVEELEKGKTYNLEVSDARLFGDNLLEKQEVDFLSKEFKIIKGDDDKKFLTKTDITNYFLKNQAFELNELNEKHNNKKKKLEKKLKSLEKTKKDEFISIDIQIMQIKKKIRKLEKKLKKRIAEVKERISFESKIFYTSLDLLETNRITEQEYINYKSNDIWCNMIF